MHRREKLSVGERGEIAHRCYRGEASIRGLLSTGYLLYHINFVFRQSMFGLRQTWTRKSIKSQAYVLTFYEFALQMLFYARIVSTQSI